MCQAVALHEQHFELAQTTTIDVVCANIPSRHPHLPFPLRSPTLFRPKYAPANLNAQADGAGCEQKRHNREGLHHAGPPRMGFDPIALSLSGFTHARRITRSQDPRSRREDQACAPACTHTQSHSCPSVFVRSLRGYTHKLRNSK